LSVEITRIVRWMEQLAPRVLAEEWDNVGLQVGRHDAAVSRTITCLSLSDAVLKQAVAAQAQVIVAHHPLIFQPLKTLTDRDPVAQRVAQLIQNDIALYVTHTNLDAAPKGVGQWLDELFDLKRSTPLVLCQKDAYVKLVTYVPATHLEVVRNAITAAGAGHIGNYAACTFAAPGTGTFLPESGTQPFIGEVGELAQVAEFRLETIVQEHLLSHVLTEMRRAHPYEEVAYDVYPLLIPSGCGYGRVGDLAAEMPFADFLAFVQKRLRITQLRTAGPSPERVRRVAVLNGSGGGYIEKARQAGATVYITGDMRYHDAEKAVALGMCVIDAGHFTTERFIPTRLAAYLRERIAAENLRCEVLEADEGELFNLL
jgi:dinuclear metal center YbgI/SA1388 family protein